MKKAWRVGVVLVGALFFLIYTTSGAQGQKIASLRPFTVDEPMVTLQFSPGREWCKTRHQLGTRLYAPKHYRRLKSRKHCGVFAKVTYARVPLTVVLQASNDGIVAGPAFVFPNNDPTATPSSVPVFTWITVDTD